jgi:zinc D-Ala-D-Ala carboxypeptidase
MNRFTETDQNCNCGCGLNLAPRHPRFLQALTTARELAGVPFVINSWTRCERHNKAVGGEEASSHLKGCAVDIGCKDSATRWKILHALMMAGFSRIGIGKTFLHADMDGEKPAGVVWLY